MRKGKKPKMRTMWWWPGHLYDARTFRTVYACECGWRCQRDGGGRSRIIDCPVCREPKKMKGVAGYKS